MRPPEIDTGSAAQIRFALIPPKGRVLNDAASFLHDLSPTGFLCSSPRLRAASSITTLP